jgi:hypothetical protein
MCGSGRGFNIVRKIKEFVNAARKQDPEFSILPLHGSRDKPDNREGIERYYRHEVKANNVNGKMRINSSMALGALKKSNSPFHNYLDDNRVYINNAQVGDEEGIALGWIFRAHPAFGFRDDIKERLIAVMTKDDKEIKHAIFPKTIKYKIVKEEKVTPPAGVTLQVAKTEGITVTEFRAKMAEKWQQLDAKTGGYLFGKKFTAFGKVGDLGDDNMTAIISKQNIFLKNSKQRIIHNLNDIDEIMEISLADDVYMGMEASGVTIREVLYNHKDTKGAQLFESIEKTNNCGTYRFLFDGAKTVEVDTILDNLDGSLASLGYWTNCHTHYRYHMHEEIRIIGSVPRSSATCNTSAFWSSHLEEFQIQGTPVEIDTSFMLHPPKAKGHPG